MVGFNLLNSSARKTVLPSTMRYGYRDAVHVLRFDGL